MSKHDFEELTSLLEKILSSPEELVALSQLLKIIDTDDEEDKSQRTINENLAAVLGDAKHSVLHYNMLRLSSTEKLPWELTSCNKGLQEPGWSAPRPVEEEDVSWDELEERSWWLPKLVARYADASDEPLSDENLSIENLDDFYERIRLQDGIAAMHDGVPVDDICA